MKFIGLGAAFIGLLVVLFNIFWLSEDGIINIQVTMLWVAFTVGGFLVYKKFNAREIFLDKLKNLAPRNKRENEDFSLHIENIKRRTGMAYYAIGVRIDDEDKEIIENGDVKSFKVTNGEHKIILISLVSKKKEKVHPPVVLSFNEETALKMKLRFTNTGELEFID